MTKFILSVGFLLLAINSFSQPTVKDILPKSPNVASLQKYEDVPVSLSKGQLNYSVPLYNIAYSDIEIPISLSYNNRGLIVANVPSWVGHGWDLSLGGAIIRQVNGLPDDCPAGIFNTQGELNNYFNGLYSLTERNQFLFRASRGETDTQPDIFSFNIAGKSGRFFFDKNRQIQQIPASPLKITAIFVPGSFQLESFRIIDELGYTYDFKVVGISQFTYSPNFPATTDPSDVNQTGVSAWFLSRVTTPKNRLIDFVYQSNGTINKQDNSRTVTLKQIDGYDTDGNSVCDLKSLDVSSRLSTTNEVVIKEILFDLGKIVFEKGEVREDVKTAFGNSDMRTLSSIQVYNLNNDLVKKISFEYGYFGNNTRLKLKRVNFLDVQQKLDNFYEFNYINEDSSFPGLHQAIGYNNGYNSQDYWGFYNGKSNETLNPNDCIEDFYFTSQVGYIRPVDTWLSNRHVDPNFAKYGLLKRIKYPTGGEIIIDYEPNQVEYDNCSISSMPQMLRTSEMNEIVNVNLASGQTRNIAFALDSDTELSITAVQVTNDLIGWLPPTITFTGPTNIQPDFMSTAKYSVSQGIATTTYNTFIRCVSAGSYSVSLSTETWDSNFNSTISLSISKPFNPNSRKVFVDGLRVSRITSCDDFGKCEKKKYNYINPKSIELPQFVGKSSRFGQRVVDTPLGSFVYQTICQFLHIYDGPLNNSFGIEYEKVIELKGENGENGKIEYQFAKIGDAYQSEPYPLPILKTWLSNIPLEQKIYSNTGGNFRILEKSNSIYTSIWVKDGQLATISDNGLKVKVSYDDGSGTGFNNEYLVGLTPLVTEFNRVSLKTNSIYSYDVSGLATELLTTNSYDYENLNHFQPTKLTEVISNNASKITILKYPMDNIGSLAQVASIAKDEMVIRNMHGNILQRIQYTNDKVIEKSLKSYEIKNGLVVFSRLEKSLGNGNYVNVLECTHHDVYGNVLEQRERDGVSVTFLYGYKATSVIASILGASFVEVLTFMGLTKEQYDYEAGLDNPSDTFRSKINALRNQLPKAQVTSYFYKPLIGITQSIDHNNFATYYTYDLSNRLKSVKDKDGNILKIYEYNYKR